MKKFLNLSLIVLCIIFFTSSCGTKNPSRDEAKNNTTPIAKTETSDSNPGTIQAVPKVPTPIPAEPSQSPTPPSSSEKSAPNKAAPKKTVPKKIILGDYKTPLLNKDKDRVNNIKLAAKKIDGYRLQPGAVFSFNDIVGKRDAANGFKVAAIIVNGEYDEDMGGGVCQLSSTLYNAADKAGLEIIERHSHSRAVSYLPAGKDAAVSYGYLDFKFKNNKDYTLEIAAWVEKGKVHASILKAK